MQKAVENFRRRDYWVVEMVTNCDAVDLIIEGTGTIDRKIAYCVAMLQATK